MHYKLQSCYKSWEKIGCSQTVLQWIKCGMDIPFTDVPEAFAQDNYKCNVKEERFLDCEIKSLLERGYIKEYERPVCISPVYCIQKKRWYL